MAGGVRKVEQVNHFLPRVGMRCRCILEDGQVVIYSSSYSYNSERIQFSETDEINDTITCIILEKISTVKTKLILDVYMGRNVAQQIMFALTKKKKMESRLQKSLHNLVALVKEIQLPAKHDGSI